MKTEDNKLVEAIQQSVEAKNLITENDGGEKVSSVEMHVLPRLAVRSALVVSSLSSIVDYIGANLDGLEHAFLHVVSPTQVDLVKQIKTPTDQRFVFVTAKWEMQGFQFERFLSHEQFVLDLQSKFVETPERETLLDVVSRIEVKDERVVEDDGTAQTVLIKSGVGAKDRKRLENQVALNPIVTFSEIKQPEFKAILRIKKDPFAVGLFNSDGGAWKHEAAQTIKAYFEKAGITLPVIA